jgi:hypothetical protein
MTEMIRYTSDAEIAEVVQRFEACTFGGAEFTHARHLTVLVGYLSRGSEQDALSAMREGLLRFSAHHNVPTLYHETITAFWVCVVDRFLRSRRPTAPLHVLANEVVRLYGDKNLVFNYYTRDRLFSPEGRAGWLEPDLRPLDVPSAVNTRKPSVGD